MTGPDVDDRSRDAGLTRRTSGVRSAGRVSGSRRSFAAALARWASRICTDARAAALAVILIACVLRLGAYLQFHSLYVDEAALAWNLIHLDLPALLGVLPYYEQAAPIGFLLATNLIGAATDYADWGLRLLPLLAGLAVVPLTFVALRGWVGAGVAAAAAGLVALSPAAIRYAVEFKHYGVELFGTAAVLCLWKALRERPGERQTLLGAGAAGLVLVTLSYTVVLVMFAAGLAYLHAIRRELRRHAGVLAVLAVWAGGLLAVNFGHTRPATVAQFETHTEYFQKGYAGFGASLLDTLALPARIAAANFKYFFFGEASLPHAALYGLYGVLGLLFLLGLWSLWRRARPLAILIMTAGLTCYGLSLAGLFPLMVGRYMLFLLPLAALALAEGADRARRAALQRAPRAAPVFVAAAVVLILPLAFQGFTAAAAPQREEVKPLVQRLYALRRPDEPVIVYYGGQPAFDYYTRGRPLPYIGGLPYATGMRRGSVVRAAYPAYVSTVLTGLEGADTAWLLLSHTYKDEDLQLLDALEEHGEVHLVLADVGAALYRFVRGRGRQGDGARAGLAVSACAGPTALRHRVGAYAPVPGRRADRRDPGPARDSRGA